jgi:MOSC domain-containing protein YiiM
MVRAFAQGRRWGIYFRVVAEGRVARGDPVVLLRARSERHLVYELARVAVVDPHDLAAIERLSKVEGLDPSWRRSLLKKLAAPAGGDEVTGEGA